MGYDYYEHFHDDPDSDCEPISCCDRCGIDLYVKDDCWNLDGNDLCAECFYLKTEGWAK